MWLIINSHQSPSLLLWNGGTTNVKSIELQTSESIKWATVKKLFRVGKNSKKGPLEEINDAINWFFTMYKVLAKEIKQV